MNSIAIERMTFTAQTFSQAWECAERALVPRAAVPRPPIFRSLTCACSTLRFAIRTVAGRIGRWDEVGCETRRAGDTPYMECRDGDFLIPGRSVSNIVFSEADTAVLARLAQSLAGRPDELLIAFYPWVEQEWARISAERWTTVHSRVLRRRRLFGFGGDNPWVVGFAHDQRKLEEVVYWAWTLPGRDPNCSEETGTRSTIDRYVRRRAGE